MKRKMTEVDLLTLQAQRGDQQAQDKLRNLLIPGMVMVVKRTLQAGQARTGLSRQIFHQYRRTLSQSTLEQSKLQGQVVEMVAQQLCDQLMAGLNKPPIGPQLMRETLVA